MSIRPWERDGAQRRQSLQSCIQNQPGIHKSALAEATGLSWGTVNFHLRVLAKTGQVRCERQAGRTRLYPAGVRDTQAVAYGLRETGSLEILACLHSNGPLGIAYLSRLTGAGERFVRSRLHALERLGAVKAGHQYHRRYGVSLQGLELLQHAHPAYQPSLLVTTGTAMADAEVMVNGASLRS